MSDIYLDFPIDHKPETTYQTVRDSLPEIMESLSIITHTDRTESSTGTAHSIIDFWTINVMEVIPGILTSFVNLGDVKIRSESHWFDSQHRIEFGLKTLNWTKLLENCEGRIEFVESDSNTLVEIHCNFTLSLSQIPGLPSFLANRFSKKLNSLAEERVKNFIPEIQSRLSEYTKSRTDPSDGIAPDK